MPKPVPRKADPGWTPYLLAFVVVAAMLNVMILIAKRTPTVGNHPTSASASASAEQVAAPASAELTVQDTPDNYGVDLYLTLRDEQDAEMAAAGRANVTAYEGDPTDGPGVWTEVYQLVPASFTRGTRGQGPFEKKAYFAHLGHVTTQELRGKTGDTLTFRVAFLPPGGAEVAAKESHSLP